MLTIGVVPGRYSVLTKGHQFLFNEAKKQNNVTYVVVIQGIKSAKDTERNPLSFELKEKLIRATDKEISILQQPSSNLPKIMKEIIQQVYNPSNVYQFNVYCGPDRKAQYEGQMKEKYYDMIKEELNRPDLRIGAKVVGITDRFEQISATEVRDAIRKGDDVKARSMMPDNIPDELYQEVKNAVIAGVPKEVFESFLQVKF